jgi:arsenate reductase-like glutaredoxin family protein
MTTLYGIKNGDTIKKARLWLDQNGVAYRAFRKSLFIDLASPTTS